MSSGGATISIASLGTHDPLNVANDGRELERLHSAQSLVEECADVAVLLARNAYITGQTISVNGGMYFAA